MFTGLVEGIGEIVALRRRGGLLTLVIRSEIPSSELKRGDSIAVHGVCLTLTAAGGNDSSFQVQAVSETLKRSNLGKLRVGGRVHLERAARVGDRLGGHLVQGHVDGLGRVVSSVRGGGGWSTWIGFPRVWRRHLVEKGSICVDGVSLTVAGLRSDSFRVEIIPATAASTLLTTYKPGRTVNLEIDLIAKYVDSLLGSDRHFPPID